MRTRSKWRDTGRARTLSENATALAYICWQIALEKAKNLHREDFDYAGDEQRTGVIAEYLYFLVHLADRMVYQSLDPDARIEFVSALGREAARHWQRNLEDVFGHGSDYRGPFIENLNLRSAHFAECRFADARPGYEMLRALGRYIQDVMGESQTNRWVIDQVMEIDGPDAVLELKKGMDNLFGTAAVMEGFTPPE